MLAAFGIAYSHAAGNRQCILDGALTKRMQAGQAASAGVFSAVLAQTGFTGARNIFNGRFGFFELYQPNGYDASVLLRDLGTAFRGEALSYKPYPCGRPLHAAIDAALAARAQLEIERADDIAAVTIEADPAGHSDQFERGPAKRRPDPGRGGAVRSAVPGGHRSGAWQDRDRGGGRSGRSPRCWRCRTGSPGSRARTAERIAEHHGAEDGRALGHGRGRRSDRLAEKAAHRCSVRGKVPRLRAQCGAAAVRMRVSMRCWRRSDGWKRCPMHAS